ncbi:MAG: tRNA (guanosine(37)-N1)-methyltransferase TrmD [Planctomycetota bacterium]|nr:tRNA (guanosine(37)-N1)-methyltransferase TrmD [Planctomycetota bacterium]
MRFDVLTLFPEIFSGFLGESLLAKAIAKGLIQAKLWNIRHFAGGKHQSVDDKPFGGGPGMVLMPGPVFDAVEAVRADDSQPGTLVMLTPSGRRLNQAVAAELAKEDRLILLCGRYEGFDERIRLGLKPIEISIGDFVCNGGEVPAMVIMETVMRLIPGFLGDPASAVEESHSEPGLLEYPQYTRPRVYRELEVPEILLSGDHRKIEAWRREQTFIRSKRDEESPIDPGELKN